MNWSNYRSEEVTTKIKQEKTVKLSNNVEFISYAKNLAHMRTTANPQMMRKITSTI